MEVERSVEERIADYITSNNVFVNSGCLGSTKVRIYDFRQMGVVGDQNGVKMGGFAAEVRRGEMVKLRPYYEDGGIRVEPGFEDSGVREELLEPLSRILCDSLGFARTEEGYEPIRRAFENVQRKFKVGIYRS